MTHTSVAYDPFDLAVQVNPYSAYALVARVAPEELLALAPRFEITGDVSQMTSLVFRGPVAAPLSLP